MSRQNALLDVNVLVALAWPTHVHHRQAHLWFQKNQNNGWATCPITQLGFLRVSSNPAIIREAVSPREALEVLSAMTALKHHQFWPDDLTSELKHLPFEVVVGHRQITDVYLLGLCKKKGGVLATFDQKIKGMLPANSAWQKSLCLIDAI